MKKPLKIAVLAGLALVFSGLVWFSVRVRQSDRAIGDTDAFLLALTYYAREHHGDLPANLAELRDGYCRIADDGCWEVILRPDLAPGHGGTFSIAHPEWFDVAWGAKADEIDASGTVVTRSRLVVQASDRAPRWFEPTGRRLSPRIAEVITSIRPQGTSTAPHTQPW